MIEFRHQFKGLLTQQVFTTMRLTCCLEVTDLEVANLFKTDVATCLYVQILNSTIVML